MWRFEANDVVDKPCHGFFTFRRKKYPGNGNEVKGWRAGVGGCWMLVHVVEWLFAGEGMINVAPGGSDGRSWRTWPPAAMANKAEPCMGLLRIHTKAERRRPLVFSLTRTHAHALHLSSSSMSKHLHVVGYQMCIPAVITGIPSVHASRRTPSATDISWQRAHSSWCIGKCCKQASPNPLF